MINQEEARLRREGERRRLIERLNAHDSGPTPHDRRVAEELERREHERRFGEAMGTTYIGGAAGGMDGGGGGCGGGGGDGGGC